MNEAGNIIDAYCERVGPGLWAEPLNALTNLAFLVAAFFVWRLMQRHDDKTPAVKALLFIMVAIGVGSGLFHTFATPWAAFLDVLPIVVFQLTFFAVYLRSVWGQSRWATAAWLLAYVGLMVAVRWVPYDWNGSVMYLPAIIALFVVAMAHHFGGKPARAIMWLTPFVFFVSLIFRAVDEMTCEQWPVGTHFLWHLLNAVLLYLLMRVLITARQRQ